VFFQIFRYKFVCDQNCGEVSPTVDGVDLADAIYRVQSVHDWKVIATYSQPQVYCPQHKTANNP